MKQKRLLGLLALMVGLIVLRWLVPPGSSADHSGSEVVAPAARQHREAPNAPTVTANQVAPSMQRDTLDVVGNAFAVRVVRVPPPPPPPPPPPRPPKVKPFIGPPAPPPPPPPPPPPTLQIIGTWDDGTATGVFLTTSHGTVLARVGTVVMAEYRVTAVTAQQLSIMHTTSQQVWQIPIPRATANR